MDFQKRYSKLNTAQKEAVDTIDGPVMVVAGPGTGKTELLSVRVANILQKTDALPENILCLTFTESGASAMRKRLADIIGKEAYKVAIHTFHSFGSEVINQNNEYFYNGANFRPADTLSSYEIINSIFEELDYNSPIGKKLNNEYTHLSDSLTVISELKKSGLTPDEILKILDENDAVIEKTEQLLSPIFANKIAKKTTANELEKHIQAIRQSNDDMPLSVITPLSHIISDSLQTAIDNSIELNNSTTPITAWRNTWFRKDTSGKFTLKSKERQSKLRAICYIYDRYLSKMQEAALYDFDDMILRVVHAMEVFNDLRFNLQEKYQYIMVDEFQDTNMAQMRILHNLTNNEIHGDTPNILVVGDDDQAIYSFQGADISNILNFKNNYPKLKQIVLTENYRSTSEILDNSRNVIIQGGERLENSIKGLSKKLHANFNSPASLVRLSEFDNIDEERNWIARDIKSRIESGEEPKNITILTRRHAELINLLPHLYQAGISVNYEHHDNILDQEPIVFIEKLSNVLIDIFKGNHDGVNANLPELLAHKAWGINATDLWKLSLKAYSERSRWLELMSTTPEFTAVQQWLIETATLVNDAPLEQILDIIIGKNDPSDDEFASPFYKYYFSEKNLEQDPDKYLIYLESLRTLRTKLREYKPNEKPNLISFIEFINLNRKIGATINITRQMSQLDNSINLMTAHASKGLEFNTVYIANAVDTTWGERARSKIRLINYPENLRLAPAGEQQDERLRLFYVAMTRAKQNLNISYSLLNDSKKNTLRSSFLINENWQPQKVESTQDREELARNLELAWYQPLIEPKTVKMHELLMSTIDNYKLSATHLNNFLDVTRGGPSAFLIQNLLRFPQAKSANATFGTVIHSILQRAHNYIVVNNKQQAIEDILTEFETELQKQHMAKKDYENYLQKGSDILRAFFNAKYHTFSSTQKTELSFSNQNSIAGDAHLTGNIDLADIDKTNKTIIVTDYKTGKPALKWIGNGDFEKIKLHKYKQQLLFYKLLIENARDYRDYKVEKGIMQFVEPSDDGNIIALDETFNTEELERFTKLINAVWNHIKDFNLPDTSSYEPSIKGILAFEQDLIDGII